MKNEKIANYIVPLFYAVAAYIIVHKLFSLLDENKNLLEDNIIHMFEIRRLESILKDIKNGKKNN